MQESFISNYMQSAIELALKGKGYVNPNPLVGAVIVKDCKIIGKGYHERFGEAHAERNAILNAIKTSGDENICRGASLFVTLEPCCHQGKQPPCTQIIIESGIAEVYIGSADPNPLVNGQGVKLLREHNIKVFENILRDECDKINPYFFHYIKTKRPFVTLKYAMSLNGTSIIKHGNKQISGPVSMTEVHKTRSEVMGIMVSSKTVNTDDCLLTNRLAENTHQPVRIILDKGLKIKMRARVLKTKDGKEEFTDISKPAARQSAPVIIFYHKMRAFKVRKFAAMHDVELIRTPLCQRHLDLDFVLGELGKRGFDSILVESSGKLAQALISKNLVNKLQVYVGSNFISENFRSKITSTPQVKLFDSDTLIEFSENPAMSGGKLCSRE
ncbi:diaminohydroxyphosphoribosylaminopyrimidine deaminase [Treponema bryantii]|uniref:Riboflavin biosynthesis protein RibD n=2 Tax=Treponema bryantii TaxID=163 RepID=A0A1H9ARW1_9SPIR|nr:diaminohydroxyphosphoribosylaminopyrimidine deaminase [Treponema bryantii]